VTRATLQHNLIIKYECRIVNLEMRKSGDAMPLPLAACTLLIAAAADLAPLEKEFTRALPACEIRVSFGASGSLARQIEHGAEFDVYLAASRRYTDQLLKVNAVFPDSVTPYARGRLAVWSIHGLRWAELDNAVRISIANPVHAPYGLAAKQALERQNRWQKLQPKLVYGENVRQAWQFAVTGNADATITAWSLAKNRGGELIPELWHDPIQQTAAIPNRSRNPEAAKRFLAWLKSPEGRKVLANHGLTP
jgi:molybdate transport system substrate-binding protein